MVPISVMKRKIGDGMSTLFWHDVWINDTLLAQQFPRLFLLEEFKNAMVGDRWNGSTLPSHYLATRWNKIVPRKLPPNELLDFVNNEDNLHKAKDIIFTIIYTVWWELWRFRNDFIFKPGKKRDVDIVDSIIQFSYLWSRNRCYKMLLIAQSVKQIKMLRIICFYVFFLMVLSPGAFMGPHLKHRGVKTGGMASVGGDFSLA
ncbi:hypothetical protein Tco_0524839 [Tanacetum coccineum]